MIAGGALVKLLMAGNLFCNDKKIFIVFFHPVLFPCILFKCSRVSFEFFQFSRSGADFFEVVIAALLKLIQLAVMPELAYNIPVIKK